METRTFFTCTVGATAAATASVLVQVGAAAVLVGVAASIVT